MKTYESVYERHADEWFNRGASAGGSFINKLFDLCSVADSTNFEKLHEAFPIEVGAWLKRQRNEI